MRPELYAQSICVLGRAVLKQKGNEDGKDIEWDAPHNDVP